MVKTDNDFITSNLPLVHSLANRFRGRGIEYEELYSAGCVGLVKASNNFDPSRGFQFSTYAVPVILGEMKRLFRDGGTVKCSRSLKELSRKVQHIQDELIKNGKEPHLSEIAELLSVSIEDVAEAISAAAPVLSLTATDDNGEPFDLPIESPDVDITERLALKQTIESLEKIDRELILLRYYNDKTQSETGKILGLSQVQVSRKEKTILKEMRWKLNDN